MSSQPEFITYSFRSMRLKSTMCNKTFEQVLSVVLGQGYVEA